MAKDWIRAVREALKLSQPVFADRIRAEGGRDTVAKWEGGARKEPGFTYTRRMVVIAPPEQLRQFLGGPAASAEMSGLERTDPGGYDQPPGGDVEDTDEARLIAKKLNVLDPVTRARAYGLCVAALEEARNPHELDADNRPDRVRRK